MHWLILIANFLIIGSVQGCYNGWKQDPKTGKCYKLITTKSSWSEANTKCENSFEHPANDSQRYGIPSLAIIKSKEENDFILSLKDTTDGAVWIGLTDQETEGTYKWIDGSKATDGFNKWNIGEPNNNYENEDCVQMIGHGVWNDAPCDRTHYAVCQTFAYVKTRCPGDWTENPPTGSCYKILNEKMTWYVAKQNCSSQYVNGRLVDISSSQENEFVKGLFSQAGESNGFWMAANDIQSEGSWVWTDWASEHLEKVSYTDWWYNEPNDYDGDEDCAMWRRWGTNGVFKWNDAPCNGKHGKFAAVCEMPACNGYFDENTGHCYIVLNDILRTWIEAKSECEAQGAALASIRSSYEWKFVKGLMNQIGVNYYVWLGGTDVRKDGTWMWTDVGNYVLFTDWIPGAPFNHTDYNCLAANFRLSWQWFDSYCNNPYIRHYAVCKIQGLSIFFPSQHFK